MPYVNRPVSPTRILVVEDNPVDAKLIRFIFQLEPEWNTELTFVEDGDEAIEYLMHSDAVKPDLVVLDLNLPKRNGTDVLKQIRIAEQLYGMRVAVFSSSPEDVIKSKVAQADVEADDYIRKPIEFSELSTLLARFRQCCESATTISATAANRTSARQR
jgi:two-component system, chemotaxis family, response regulator Rcp1